MRLHFIYLNNSNIYSNTHQVHAALAALNTVMQTLYKNDEFTEEILVQLDRDIDALQGKWVTAFLPYAITHLQIPKFHALKHMVLFIRMYGSPKNWDTGTYELFHKQAAKIPYKHTNHREGLLLIYV
jgi:hypothetical protein